jgi:hypothetical protein
MPWPKNRKDRGTGRRTASTTDEVIRQIAHDKSIGRFQPRPAGVEAPRDVFMAAVDEVAAHFSEMGWRYAKSGPHMSQRHGDISAKLAFVSNRLNVAGELVGLWVNVHLADHTIGKWRKEIGNPLATGSQVADRHLGHLLDPPGWLEWDLAQPDVRPAAARDIVETIESAALPWIESMRQLLDGGRPEPGSLIGQVTQTSLIEYLIRAGRLEDAAAVIRAAVDRFDGRARVAFASQLDSLRRDELPPELPGGGVAVLAYAVIRFDLPLDVPDSG